MDFESADHLVHMSNANTVHAHLRHTQHDLSRLIIREFPCNLRVRHGQPQQALPCVSCLMHGPAMQH